MFGDAGLLESPQTPIPLDRPLHGVDLKSFLGQAPVAHLHEQAMQSREAIESCAHACHKGIYLRKTSFVVHAKHGGDTMASRKHCHSFQGWWGWLAELSELVGSVGKGAMG